MLLVLVLMLLLWCVGVGRALADEDIVARSLILIGLKSKFLYT